MFKIEITADNVTELKVKLREHMDCLFIETDRVSPDVQAPLQTEVPQQQQQQSVPVQQQQQQPEQQYVPVQQQPAPQQAQVPTAVPTQAPTYTHEQLSVAAANLADSNPAAGPQLTAIIQQYGVQALSQIPVDQLGAVAQQFRQLGALI